MSVIDIDVGKRDRMLAALNGALQRVEDGTTFAIAVVEVHRDAVSTFAIVNNRYHQLNSGAARLAYQLASQASDDTDDNDAA